MAAATDLDRVAMIVLRFMRRPVFTLIFVYAVGITGMALIPGRVIDGETQYMSLFHAFYFFTYTATTTGFGEIPTAFSDEQRLWTVFCLYIGVIAWLYAIGSIIRLVQNEYFILSFAEYRFARRVRAMREPFFILCGFGDTGSLLARGLHEHGFQAVIIDRNPERIKALGLRDYKELMPGMCADASAPRHLLDAGVQHPCCRAIVILHSDEDINLKIAVLTRYLNPSLPILARATMPACEQNLTPLGGVTTINPFEIFAQLLSMAITSPKLHNLNSWLVRAPGVRLGQQLDVPRGSWILCGYGRMGQWLHTYMIRQGLDVVVIDPDVDPAQVSSRAIRDYADETALKEADIEGAAGIVAGTDDDVHNLRILICARKLNPSVFTILRQNEHANQPAFDAADANLVLQSSLTTARRVLKHLISPLSQPVIDSLAMPANARVLDQIVGALAHRVGDEVPHLWRARLDFEEGPAAVAWMRRTGTLRLGDLLRDPGDRDETIGCVVLAIERDGGILIAPDESSPAREGDEMLLCGTRRGHALLEATLNSPYTLDYLVTGDEPPRALVFRWLESRGRDASPA